MSKYEANWSGSSWCYCQGDWTLYRDGKNITRFIPKDKRETHMNTFGVYSRWYFKDWMEDWEEYLDGLEEQD